MNIFNEKSIVWSINVVNQQMNIHLTITTSNIPTTAMTDQTATVKFFLPFLRLEKGFNSQGVITGLVGRIKL